MYNEQEQLRQLKLKVGLTTYQKDEYLLMLLEDARCFINNRRRFKPTASIPLESKYYSLQVRLCVCAYNKQGAEGEKSHNENGFNRGYETGSEYPTSLVREIVPLAK